ncbi:MAG: hypothetical protein CMJ75_09575 [Planctomycetaceae bacterium]|nr:hypothetical protein [Planctomycetaceae bacterium]
MSSAWPLVSLANGFASSSPPPPPRPPPPNPPKPPPPRPPPPRPPPPDRLRRRKGRPTFSCLATCSSVRIEERASYFSLASSSVIVSLSATSASASSKDRVCSSERRMPTSPVNNANFRTNVVNWRLLFCPRPPPPPNMAPMPPIPPPMPAKPPPPPGLLPREPGAWPFLNPGPPSAGRPPRPPTPLSAGPPPGPPILPFGADSAPSTTALGSGALPLLEASLSS